MKIQKIKLGENKYTWLVLGNDYLPIPTIQEFIRYLTNIEKSPNTIRAYAHHLKLYWEFLTDINVTWDNMSLSELAEFVRWLRANNSNIIVLDETVSTRKETTINSILAALASFYRYYSQIGKTDIQLTCYKNNHRKAYKSLLHHITKSKPSKQRVIKLKTVKTVPKTLEHEQVEALLAACVSHRDRFLVSLLYETGMRIGQALSLYHKDVCSWNNEVILKPRTDLENGARSKSRKTYTVHVTPELMSLYNK